MTQRFMESQSSENSLLASSGWLNSAKQLFLFAGLVVLTAQLVVCVIYAWKSRSLLSFQSQVILDRGGYPLRHTLSARGERRNWLHLQELPPLLPQIFIESEDKRFYDHIGVDALSLARVARDLFWDRELRSGASTISMQLSKIYWPELKSPIHKGTQMLLALYFESVLTKGEILTEYLNSVPFGFQRAGVGAACDFFFGASCTTLSPSQLASLAVIPRNPGYYTKDLSALFEMKNRLLSQMVAEVDPASLELALAEPVRFVFQPSEFVAPQFTRRVLNQALPGEEIQSSLDYHLQKELQERFRTAVDEKPLLGDSGALLVIDNRTHTVLSYIGSPDFFQPEIGQIDAVMATRSPGSTMKPFLYSYAIENGYSLSDVVPDIPMTFSIGRKVYEPTNYGGDYSGPVTIRRALANSKNIPALYLTSLLGTGSVLESFKRWGLTNTTLPDHHFGVGIAIGNLETTLWSLVQAYSVLANRGQMFEIGFLADHNPVGVRVMDQEVADLITSVLTDHQSRSDEFGRGSYLELDLPVAVKTGTSNDFRDTWILSYSPDFTVGMWRGNASGVATEAQAPAAKSLGPLLKAVWTRLYQFRSPVGFKLSSELKRLEVCPLSGMRAGPSCPSSHHEFFLAGKQPKHDCRWHKTVKVASCQGEPQELRYVELPPEYKEWSASGNLPTLKRQLKQACGVDDLSQLKNLKKDIPKLSIVEPLDQSVYAIDPNIPNSHQMLKVVHRGAQDGEIKLIIDGQLFKRIRSESDEVFLPLKKGQHKMYLESEQGQRSNAVSFMVK
ncbi:MAG: transglycosylase domain-containing protein [Bdellovibrionales bacterium]|nr:transglycosylase domain-containing protein [Bdellovibrionales bacterium]